MGRHISFFDKQPAEIVDIVTSMATTHTAPQIAEHLKSIGVEGVTDSIVCHFRQKHKLSPGYHKNTDPAGTFDERVLQYIDAITEHDGNEFTSRYLGLRGHIWTPCAIRLCKAGLIERVDGRCPSHYTQLSSPDDMYAWYSDMIK